MRSARGPDPNANRTHITVAEVFYKLRQIETCRADMERAWLEFADWLDGAPELAEVWTAFTKAGGLTATEFMHFLDGKFRPHPVRQHGHLRLLPSNEPRLSRRQLR